MAGLNKKWTYYGHQLEIKPEQFEINEAGVMRKGLIGTMDGKVKQATMNIFRADWPTFCHIEHMLELHASGKWSD